MLGLDGAPDGFEDLLQPWPDGASVVRDAKRARGLKLWFVRTHVELARGIAKRVPRSESSGLWIVWPKLTSALSSGLREDDIRRAALAAGMVDFKVCAFDADWSALRRESSENRRPMTACRGFNR